MKKQDIKNIIAEAKSLSSYEERLFFLKDKFKGQTCYLISCGPSLRDVNKEKLIEEVKDKCLVSVKQSYFTFKDFVDFQFFNSNNFIPYPNNDNAFFVGQADFDSEQNVRAKVWKNQQVDLLTRVKDNPPLAKLQYEDWFEVSSLEEHTFENSGLARNWGAGIVFESVLYFLYHLGFTDIKTIGWDFVDPSTSPDESEIEHFYPESRRRQLANPAADPYVGEMLEGLELSDKFYLFFQNKGTFLSCMKSEKTYLSDKYKRFNMSKEL